MSHPATRVMASLGQTIGEPTDTELLARFTTDRDASAFELLVWRHAGLVFRTCRGVLRDYHAAEDATQAVFLALARQASSIDRTSSVAGWLFRVAHRVAIRAARQKLPATTPGVDLDTIPAFVPTHTPDPELERVLHEEVACLSEPYRTSILLCFFGGLTHADAARRLGVPVGTVAGRMARAKDQLASRLTRRGLTLALVPVVVAVKPSFVSATTHAAIAFLNKRYSELPATALNLAKQELEMTLTKKLIGVATLALAISSVFAFGLQLNAEPNANQPSRPTTAEKLSAPKPPPIIEKRFAIAPITTALQRRLLQGEPNSAVVVLMDGSPLFKTPQTLNVEAFDLTALRNGLKTFHPQKGKSIAHFMVHYAPGNDISADGSQIIGFTLEGMARKAGFVPTNTLSTHHASEFVFEKFIEPLKDDKGAEEQEDSVGDERAKAYPVRTPLSRVLTQSSSGVPIAGVVDVLPPLDCTTDDWIPEDVDKSVRTALGKLKLTKNQRVNFLLNVPKRDIQTQGRVRTACKRWAEDRGLELWSFSY